MLCPTNSILIIKMTPTFTEYFIMHINTLHEFSLLLQLHNIRTISYNIVTGTHIFENIK